MYSNTLYEPNNNINKNYESMKNGSANTNWSPSNQNEEDLWSLPSVVPQTHPLNVNNFSSTTTDLQSIIHINNNLYEYDTSSSSSTPYNNNNTKPSTTTTTTNGGNSSIIVNGSSTTTNNTNIYYLPLTNKTNEITTTTTQSNQILVNNNNNSSSNLVNKLPQLTSTTTIINDNKTELNVNNNTLRPQPSSQQQQQSSVSNSVDNSSSVIGLPLQTKSLNFDFNNAAKTSTRSSAVNYNVNNFPTIFTTQKLNNSVTKLSYTPYQLELLNSIYADMKYPNSVQKTLIAKRIGITREQLKVWFQNRRRKDTIKAQMKEQYGQNSSISLKRRRSEDEYDEDDAYSSQNESNGQRLVDTEIINGVLNELRNHKNAPSRLSSKRSKSNRSKCDQNENNENLLTHAININDSQVLKKTPNDCIIDLCPLMNKTNSNMKQQTSNESTEQKSQQMIAQSSSSTGLSSSSSSTISTSSSNLHRPNDFYLQNSSGSSALSSSYSGTSSSSEEIESNKKQHPQMHTQAYDQKFQVLQQPMSIQNFLQKKYYPTNYYYQQHQQPQHQQVQQQQQQWTQQPYYNPNYLQQTQVQTNVPVENIPAYNQVNYIHPTYNVHSNYNYNQIIDNNTQMLHYNNMNIYQYPIN